MPPPRVADPLRQHPRACGPVAPDAPITSATGLFSALNADPAIARDRRPCSSLLSEAWPALSSTSSLTSKSGRWRSTAGSSACWPCAHLRPRWSWTAGKGFEPRIERTPARSPMPWIGACLEPPRTPQEVTHWPEAVQGAPRRAVAEKCAMETTWRALYGSYLSGDERLMAIMIWHWDDVIERAMERFRAKRCRFGGDGLHSRGSCPRPPTAPQPAPGRGSGPPPRAAVRRPD